MRNNQRQRLLDIMGMLDRDLAGELKHLLEIEEWAYAQQPFQVGDKVVLKETVDIDRSSGWWICREFLVKGSTGVILDVFLFSGRDKWGVLFQPDVQWRNYRGSGWHDDKDERHFVDKLSCFYFDPSKLRKRKKKDKKLVIPADTTEWAHKIKATS